MLSLLQQPSDLDAFAFFLATKLGKTLGEIEAMPLAEYNAWKAYFTAKHAIENQSPATGV